MEKALARNKTNDMYYHILVLPLKISSPTRPQAQRLHEISEVRCSYYNQTTNPTLFNLPTSPPASITALTAASLNFRRFSSISFSRLALVLLLPLGATPVSNLALSSAVKLTKPTAPDADRGVRGPLAAEVDLDRA